MQTEFFKHLFEYCDGKIEIRLLPSGKQRYFALNELDALAQCVKQNSKQDIYFGCAARDGKGGKKENIIHFPCVWTDCDFKDIDRKELFKRLKSFPFSPSAIVRSGGGCHLYWLLDEPAGKEDIERIEDCNRRIAAHFGGDFNACDAARILRVPDTKNRKYKPMRDVKVSQLNKFYYILDDFLDLLPKVEATKRAKNGNGKPEKWLLEALRGSAEGERNATAAKICGYFINKSNRCDLLTILTAWNCHNESPLDEKELVNVLNSIARYKQQSEAPDESSSSRERVTITFS